LAADGIGNTENIFFIYWQARRDKKDSKAKQPALGIVAMPGRAARTPYEIA
jgi:hypothetical protein